MIRVESITVIFDGKRRILSDVSLTLQEGELLGVMGSSGGGKTTLLRSIAGLVTPVSGSVYVSGVDVHRAPDLARKQMGMVFQSAALFDYMTVAENVLFGVRRHLKLSPSHQQALLKDTLSRVGLSGTEALLPSELSGGMRKRVGIARAIALSPKVMLYDEPTTGLDPITTYQIDSVIAGLRKSLNVTGIVVSHDLVSLQRIADRIAFLHQGEIVFDGSPAAFVRDEHPAIEELVTKTQTTHLL